MISRDYIVRALQMLSRFLSKVLLHKELKEYNQARDEIDRAAKQVLGFEFKSLKAFSDVQLLRLWTPAGQMDLEKVTWAAYLFKAEGDISESQMQLDDSTACYTRALNLCLNVFSELRSSTPQELVDTIVSLIEIHRHVDLPMSVRKHLTAFYTELGQFSKAEDIWFELIDKDPSHLEEGIRFYEQLQQKPDSELIRGNLPRNEVLAGLEELKRRRLILHP